MPLLYKKGLLYPGITCDIYIIFPLVLFSILSDLNIMPRSSRDLEIIVYTKIEEPFHVI